MAIRDAPKAVETKLRREKDRESDGLSLATSGAVSFLSSIACSLIARIQKQNGRLILTAGWQLGWTPLSLESALLDSRPAAFDRAFCNYYRNGRARHAITDETENNLIVFNYLNLLNRSRIAQAQRTIAVQHGQQPHSFRAAHAPCR
jgi:hypothetical protein